MQDTTAVVEDETSFDIFEEADFEEQTEETAETEAPANEPIDEDVIIKYMGKETPVKGSAVKELSDKLGIEDIPACIQKGMNYDKAVTNTPLHKTVQRLAEANGKNFDEYVEFLNNTVDAIRVNREVEELRDRFPDFNDEALKELAKVNIEKEELTKFKAGKETEERQRKEESDKTAAELEPYREFHAKYPDVEKFTEKEAELINKGVSPIVAHEIYLENMARQKEIDEIKEKLNRAENMGNNYYSSMGSVKSTTNEEADDFLSGFDSL